eukprot:971557-Pyramimonas_sp.AAC.1
MFAQSTQSSHIVRPGRVDQLAAPRDRIPLVRQASCVHACRHAWKRSGQRSRSAAGMPPELRGKHFQSIQLHREAFQRFQSSVSR